MKKAQKDMLKGAVVAIVALVFKEDWYFMIKQKIAGGQN